MAAIFELKNVTQVAPIDYSTVSPTGTAGSLGTTGSTWVEFPTAGACGIKLLLSDTSTSGDFATVRMRARGDGVKTGGVVCGNFSASGGVNDHGNLYALQGYAQPNAYTQSIASHISCGVYSCIDALTTSSGRRWSTWTDDHSNVAATGGHFLHRLSYNPTNGVGDTLGGVWTIYGANKVPFLFNFEIDQAGNPFVAGAAIATGAALGTIRVKTSAGTTGYINVLAQS
jgi:hypothetical protein